MKKNFALFISGIMVLCGSLSTAAQSSQQDLDKAANLENERANLKWEANYYEYLNAYLSEKNTQEVPISPATMGIEDPLLERCIQELADLQAEYFRNGNDETNPQFAQIETEIKKYQAKYQGNIKADPVSKPNGTGRKHSTNQRIQCTGTADH
jgi:hypothetical protein